MIVCSNCGHEFDAVSTDQCPFCGQACNPPGPEPPLPSPSPEVIRDGPSFEKASSLLDAGAILCTIKEVLFEPVKTFRTMKREGGLSTSFFYALVLGTFSGLIATLWSHFFYMPFFSRHEDPVFSAIFSPGVSLAWAFVCQVVMTTISLFVFSLILHGCLHLAGGANRPFETTFRVYTYVSGATAVFIILPFIGWIITIGWSLVCGIIGLREAHETTMNKAAVAVLLPLVLCCGCGLFLVFFFGGLAFLGSSVN